MPPAAEIFTGAAGVKPPLIASTNIFGAEYLSSVDSEPDKPISGGLWRVEKGQPVSFSYDFHESKYLIEGELDVTTSSGLTYTARAGDIMYFPKGCTATFSSKSYGLAFYCAQRPGQATVKPTAKL